MSASKFFDYGVDAGTAPAMPAFLVNASVEDWAVIGSHCERRRFTVGDVIIQAGDADRALFVVLEGELATIAERRGRQRRLSPAAAGSVVGEIGFLDGLPRSASVIATSDGELLRMSFASFERLAATHSRLGQSILLDLGRILAARLRTMTNVVMAR